MLRRIARRPPSTRGPPRTGRGRACASRCRRWRETRGSWDWPVRLHPAHCEDHVLLPPRRRAGSRGRRPVDEEANARGVPALDLRAVRRCGARHHRPGLLHPAERRDVLVRAQQDPRLAGARLRGEVGLPLGQAVGVLGQPAGHGGRVAVAHRPAQDGQGKPIDLEEDDAGNVGGRDGTSGGARSRRARRSEYVLSEPRITARTTLTAATTSDARMAQPNPSTVSTPSVRASVTQQDAGVRDEHEQEAEHECRRQPQGRQHRRDQRVQHRDDRRNDKRSPEPVDADPGQDPGGHHERHARWRATRR